MQLASKLVELIRACFTGIWIESHEHEDALVEVAQLCQQEQWRMAIWDIDQGLHLPGQPAASDADAQDPLAAIRSVNSLATEDGTALLVLQNFHRFLQSPEIVQALIHQITTGKQNRTFIVVLAPIVQIPTELEKLFIVLEHQLPDREQLGQIACGIATEDGELPSDTELETVLDAAIGLTRYEAEAAFSLSLVRHDRVLPEAVWELKAGMLKKSGLLSLYRGEENFTSLGGLDSLKAFCRRSLLQPGRSNPLKRPRGVLLLGVPGTGKSAFAKALGRETGRPTLILDVGSLMGSLVGSTEANVRQALQIADAMAPCILFCDEVEKALSGVTNSGQTDSGVSARLFGSLLTWMNDHTSDVYMVATCNDISKLPPEFSRAERFDGVFFLNLPDREQRSQIWDLYLRLFELDPDQRRPKDDQFTGAEIRACCRLAALLDVPLVQAAQNVVPVAVTAAESVDRLRTWASGRCLDADRSGIYTQDGGTRRKRRKVARDSLAN
ncbi:MAG: AAA family ATPase [Planctomycetes bacterium]|nr:AAA family ATPase [Planctomycetota bacterium]